MRSQFASLFALIIATSGCGSILGLDDFGAASGEGGGSSSTANASTGTADATSSTTTGGEGGSGAGDPGAGAGGAGSAGGGGEGGGGEPCDDDGATEACYGGEPDTLGVGVCVAGERVCEGGTWSACEGAVVPQEEDLFTWTDESCSLDSAEIGSAVRYAGTNDDFIAGMAPIGPPGPGNDVVVAVGIYDQLTLDGQTFTAVDDLGTVLVRHRPDGSIAWARGLVASPLDVTTGTDHIILSGFAYAPLVVDGVTLPPDFLALLDGTGTVRDAIDQTALSALRDHHGIAGRTVRRVNVNLAQMTLSTTLLVDFSPHFPNAVSRTSVPGATYLVIGGHMDGALSIGTCSANTPNRDGFIAVLSTLTNACASVTTLGAAGTATVTDIATAGDRLFVSGTFSGSIRDERGTTLVSEGASSAFVARMALSASGEPSLVWLRAFGGTGATSGGSIVPLEDGGAAWLARAQNADFGGTLVGPGPVFVVLGFDGAVRYVREDEPGVAITMDRTAESLLFSGDLSGDATPFELVGFPAQGSNQDAFFARAALP